MLFIFFIKTTAFFLIKNAWYSIFVTILWLALTIVIAFITLFERKLLSVIQRRVGPFHVGYKGRLQFIADALKLLSKELFLVKKVNNFFYVIIPILYFCVSYLSFANVLFYNNLYYSNIEYNLLYFLIFSSMSNILIFLTGFFSYNKYTYISSIRSFLILFNTDFLISLFFLNVLLINQSFSFSNFILLQENFLNFFFFFNLLIVIFFLFLIECGRSPFDILEAESELVSGYNTEYGGFFFASYYLGEYVHLFNTCLVFNLIFFSNFDFNFFLLNNYYFFFI